MEQGEGCCPSEALAAEPDSVVGARGGSGPVPPGGWLHLEALTTVECAQVVDRAALDRVLVHGSPPGEGRDLDLLVRPSSEESVAAALLEEGFRRAGHRFVRFRQGTCEQVELYPSSGWGLPEEEERALFDEAVPLRGFEHLVRPSPAHTLLILARRVVEGVGVLDEKRRRYVDWSVARDPKAWDHAAERSGDWHGGRSLELLERLVGRGFISRARRVPRSSTSVFVGPAGRDPRPISHPHDGSSRAGAAPPSFRSPGSTDRANRHRRACWWTRSTVWGSALRSNGPSWARTAGSGPFVAGLGDCCFPSRRSRAGVRAGWSGPSTPAAR